MPVPGRRRRPSRVTAGAALAVVLAGCSNGSASGDVDASVGKRLGDLTLQQTLPGYVVDTHASGPLGLAGAAAGSPAGTDPTKAALRSANFGGGFARVWTKGDAFMTELAWGFDHPVAAGSFAVTLIGLLKSQSVYTAAMPDVQGGHVYTLTGVTKSGSKPVFCQGAIFAAGATVFDVRTCDARPGSTAPASLLAQQQIQRVTDSAAAASPAPPSTGGSP